MLLLAGLVLLPFSPQTASFLVAAYWLALLLFCAWLFWLDRNTDNFTLLMLLAAFMVCQTAYAMTDSLKLLRAQVHLNMAAVMFVSIRVSILLGAEALKESTLKDPVFIPNVVYKKYRNYIFYYFIPQQSFGYLHKQPLLQPLPLALSCLPSYANYIITNCYVNITYALIISFNCSPRLVICGLA